MCHAVPGKWCVFGCMLSAGGSFQWFRNNLGAAEIAEAKKEEDRPLRTARRPGRARPRPAAKACYSSPISPANAAPIPIPTPAADGSASPPAPPDRMLIRSLLEGVTFGMRDALEIMQSMNIPITQVRASGGGARSEFWRQLQADIYQKPIVTTNADRRPRLRRRPPRRRRRRRLDQRRRGLPLHQANPKTNPPQKIRGAL